MNMFASFKSLYRVNKINQESKNTPINSAIDITKHAIKELNILVKRIFESDKAYITVSKNPHDLYDVEFHSGIQGPINYEYFSRRFLGIARFYSVLKYLLTKGYNNEIM